jgi:hypothetical protein
MYQIRKNKKVTSVYTTEVAELNPESFKTLSIPFLGSTEEDFLYYIQDNSSELGEIADELDSATITELNKLLEPTWVETYNSDWDGEDSWVESGNTISGDNFLINYTSEY